MTPLSAVESTCDYALQCARLMARYQVEAQQHPIARRSNLYQASRMKRKIVNAAIFVEVNRQRELDRLDQAQVQP